MQIKDYYIPVIHTFEFIDTEEQAQNSIKTVLGAIVSSLSDDTAREFTAQLPDWLDYETLRGAHQVPGSNTPANCVDILKESHGLDENQAQALMRKVVALTVQESPGNLGQLIVELPDEWEEIFNQSPEKKASADETTL